MTLRSATGLSCQHQARRGGRCIYSKFFSLKPEKQTRIINAAFKEFAQKGYVNASTNNIVKEAEISKGILFHYFNSKKELFLFLYDFTMDVLTKDYFGRLDATSRDIFERLKQISSYKLELTGRFPEMFNFIMVAHFEGSHEVREDLDKRNNQLLLQAYAKTYENIDPSPFKEGIDIKKAIEIINWTLEGFAVREQEKLKHSDNFEQELKNLFDRFDPYRDILKKSFYK